MRAADIDNISERELKERPGRTCPALDRDLTELLGARGKTARRVPYQWAQSDSTARSLTTRRLFMFRTSTADQLRYDAQLAYREGQTEQARRLNSIADNVDRYPAAAAADLARISSLGAEGALVITRRQPSLERVVTTSGTVAACLTLAAVGLCGLLWLVADRDIGPFEPYTVTLDK
jgi:hypothetical protein